MAIAIKSDSFVFVLPRKKLELMKVSWATQGHWVSGPSLSPGDPVENSPLVTLFVRSLIQSKQQIWFPSHLILLLCEVLASSNFHWWRRADIFLVRAHQSETESWAAPDSWHCVGPIWKETQWTAVALIRSECRKVARPLIAWGVTKIRKLFWPHN